MRDLSPLLLGVIGAAACIDPSSSSSSPATSDSYDGLEITADVAPAEGRETVRATVAQVTIRDASGAMLASAPTVGDPDQPAGSRDEVLGIRVAEGYVGTPLIAVTTTLGGHRESTTWLALYRVEDSQLEQLFAAPLEQAEDESTATGALFVLPGALLYRAPHAERPTLYGFDAAVHRYVAR